MSLTLFVCMYVCVFVCVCFCVCMRVRVSVKFIQLSMGKQVVRSVNGGGRDGGCGSYSLEFVKSE